MPNRAIHQFLSVLSLHPATLVSKPCPPRQSSGTLALLLNLRNDVLLQCFWLRDAPPPLHNLSIPVDQELLKVPLDALQSQESGLLAFHPFPYRLGFAAVDVRLAQHREADAIVELTKFLDLVVRAWILASELVARKAEDDELVWVFLRDALP